MSLYHLTPEDEITVCSAKTPESCKFKDNGLAHFKTKDEGLDFRERKLERDLWLLKTLSKTDYVDLPGAFGTIRAKNGDLSIASTRLALVSGLCGSLALAIHNKTGSTPYFVCYGLPEGSELSGAKDKDLLMQKATHALVESVSEPGMFIDAYGRKSLKELKDFYGDDIVMVKGDKFLLEAYAEEAPEGTFDGFADAAIKLDSEGKSYDYNDFDEDFDVDAYEGHYDE